MEASNPGNDGFQAVPTYDLRHARYDSPYIAFSSKEVLDHNFKPLDTLASVEEDYVNRFDAAGGIPFMVINGQ
jgi:hypothetical protein